MIFLDRIKFTSNETFGMLTGDPIQSHVFTIERPWLNNQHGISCIPNGVYDVEKYISPTKGDVWLLQNVPNRSEIEIHPANFASQLEGCIAPGNAMGEIGGVPAVLGSQVTFHMLKSVLPDKFQLTITGTP